MASYGGDEEVVMEKKGQPGVGKPKRFRREKLFKTQLCRHVEANGQCSHGARCHFAHSADELKTKPAWKPAEQANGVVQQVVPPAPPYSNGGPPSNQWAYAAQEGYAQEQEYPGGPPDYAVLGNGDYSYEQYYSYEQEQQQLPAAPVVNNIPALRPASSRYKTQLCRHFEQRQRCPRGASCTFAHSPAELRGSNPGGAGTGELWSDPSAPTRGGPPARHKKKVPGTTNGYTPKDPTAYAGGARPMFKTRLCRYFTDGSTGRCPRGESCGFAHAEEELRPAPVEGAVTKGKKSDWTEKWKHAVYTGRRDLGRLRALRDHILELGGSLNLPPTVAPPTLKGSKEASSSSALEEEDGEIETLCSAFAAGARLDMVAAATAAAALSSSSSASSLEEESSSEAGAPRETIRRREGAESAQVRYIVVEIECCFAEELRGCAEVHAAAERYEAAATYLAASFELLLAVVSGTEPWRRLAEEIKSGKKNKLSGHDAKGGLSTILQCVQIVVDATVEVRDKLLATWKSKLEALEAADEVYPELDQLLKAMDLTRRLRFAE